MPPWLLALGLLFIGALGGDRPDEPGAERCLGRAATIGGSEASERLRGTSGSDVIVARGGNDTVIPRGGNDRVCGGPGRDRILGGRGVDRLSGGGGADRIGGGRASDRIGGGAQRDRLLGERGNDRLRGGSGGDFVDSGLGDDKLRGGGGADALVAGLGIDHLFGESGDDLLRGDFGPDELAGGAGGGDVASFAMATPPGPAGIDGVLVELDEGWSLGDGRPDRLRGIEDVAGSAFADRIRGDAGSNRLLGGPGADRLHGGAGRDEANGGSGADRCRGGRYRLCGGERAGPRAEVELLGGRAPVLVAVGASTPDRIEVVRRGRRYFVSGARPGPGCERRDSGRTLCVAAAPLTGLLVFGGAGSDLLRLAPGMPSALTARLDGYRGNDRLVGGNGSDILDAGPGRDDLDGRGGSDAVTARTRGDRVTGGAASDLVVVADPCEGHRLRGGSGVDSVSFARLHYRSRSRGIRARIGGEIVARGYDCARPDRIVGAVESLEGSWGPDLLIGDGGANTLLGRYGPDRLHGQAGADRLVGGGGRDRLHGGGGRDRRFR